MKKVIVFTTVGAKKQVFETEATTWSSLRNQIQESGFDADFNKMTAIVKETKVTLDNDEAILPETDFTLFLYKRDTDKGITGVAKLGFKELRAVVKDLVEKHGDHVKQTLGNYTQMSTDALRAALAAYKEPKAKAVKVAPVVVKPTKKVVEVKTTPAKAAKKVVEAAKPAPVVKSKPAKTVTVKPVVDNTPSVSELEKEAAELKRGVKYARLK